MKKYIKNERYIWISIILFVIILQFSPFCSSIGNSSNEDNERKYFELVKEAITYIRTWYVDDSKINYKNLMHGAIKGMLESLKDDHTSFLNEKEFKEIKESTTGAFGGLGIVITIKDEYPTVIAPIEDSPAYKLGIEPGDKIVEIEGKTSRGMKIEEVVKKLKGDPGTRVSIKIAREGALDLIPFVITRAIINVPSVKSGFINKNKGLAYLKITTFSMKTPDELQVELEKLNRGGMKKLIIDLRNNPGGLLSSVVKVVNMFLNSGKIVYTKGRYEKENQVFYASKDNTIVSYDIPIVILINEGSASASEIFAGALQDTKRAILIGTKSFGKGSVQTIIKLERSHEEIAMRLTIQKYYTPAGRSIHGKGIKPDIEVKLPKLDFEQIYMEKKLFDGKYIKEFIKKYPRYTKNQVDEFYKLLTSKGITLKLTDIQRKLKDQSKRKGLQLFDIDYDIQLKKSVEIISNKKHFGKTVTVFR